MKKILLASVIGLLSTGAMATALCDGTSGGPKTVDAASGSFNVTAIKSTCSQNVFLDYSGNSTSMGVGTGSKKGKTAYKGNTAGGAVTRHADCPTTGCTATESGAAATQALTDAASSS